MWRGRYRGNRRYVIMAPSLTFHLSSTRTLSHAVYKDAIAVSVNGPAGWSIHDRLNSSRRVSRGENRSIASDADQSRMHPSRFNARRTRTALMSTCCCRAGDGWLIHLIYDN